MQLELAMAAIVPEPVDPSRDARSYLEVVLVVALALLSRLTPALVTLQPSVSDASRSSPKAQRRDLHLWLPGALAEADEGSALDSHANDASLAASADALYPNEP